MKKRSKFIVIILFIFTLVGIGGMKYMENEYQKQKAHQLETSVAKNVISEYQGIRKIEFKKVIDIGDGYIQLLFSINDSREIGYDVNPDNPNDGEYSNSYEFLEATPLRDSKHRESKIPDTEINIQKYQIIYSEGNK